MKQIIAQRELERTLGENKIFTSSETNSNIPRRKRDIVRPKKRWSSSLEQVFST
jgi:hypothetical protein